MCKRVDIDYREAPDEAERRKKRVRFLAEGVYLYLKRKGLLAAQAPVMAENDAPEAHSLGSENPA